MTSLEEIFEKFKKDQRDNLEIILENQSLTIVYCDKEPKKIEMVDFQKENEKYFVYYSTFFISNAKNTFLECPNYLKEYLSKEPLKSFKEETEKESKKVPPFGYYIALFLKKEIEKEAIEETAYFFIERFKEKNNNSIKR